MSEGTQQPDPGQPQAAPEPALPQDPNAPPTQAAWPPPPAGQPPAAWPPPPAGQPPAAWPPPPAGQSPAAWPPPPAGQSPAAWPPPPAGQSPAAWPPAAAYAGATTAGPSTSVLVVLAGIFLLIVGILTFGFGTLFGLLGGLVAAVGTSESGFEVFGPIGSLVAGLAFVVVLWGLLEIVASIGMFIHRGWGRALGLIVGVAGALFGVLALLGSFSASDASGGGIGFSLVLLAGYGLTVLALVTGGEHFRRRA
jgi:hypothetical protein